MTTGAPEQTTVLDRADGAAGGELVLRRAGDHFEIISNGTFLMDTRNGESERLLVRAALDLIPHRPARLLLGGLGIGFSLREALRPRPPAPPVSQITVVEIEPAVIGWHATHLRDRSAGALDDPRVQVVHADLAEFIRERPGHHDAICLDIDNGPDWTLNPRNARLYDDDGLALLAARLAPGGILAVWSAGASPAFETRLRARFAHVRIRPVPVPRGEPDMIYIGGSR